MPGLEGMVPERAGRACQILRSDTKTRHPATPTYTERVNLAIDHVLARLDEPLRLEDVARAAMLSPFHFHRVFRAMMGETLNEFVKRLRLERALVRMAQARRPSLTAIALACGFSSSSDFSRCFKQRYGAAPSAFDIAGWRASHRAELEALTPGVGGKDARPLHVPRLPEATRPEGLEVKIRELPARTVAYIRVENPYQGDGVVRAARRLVDWARRNNLAGGRWLGYQWDNPEITSLENCRYFVAVEAERFTAKGEIGLHRFPAMMVAEVEIRGGIDLELRALQWLYAAWLPRSVYLPDDYPGFEAWKGEPFAHGFEHFELDLQVPIRRA